MNAVCVLDCLCASRCETCMQDSCCRLCDHRGWTALHSASQYGHYEVAVELIKVIQQTVWQLSLMGV